MAYGIIFRHQGFPNYMIIDCAFDEDLAQKLSEYLSEKGFSAKKEKNAIIITKDPKLTKDELEIFLKKTGKIKELELIPVESDTVIIATKVMIEHFGLARCTICGFVTYKEDLISHERAHGIYLA